ncbi:MAG: exodeoxyribonuclease VII small subunit [Erysipelotrichaceae bacterium]
MKEKSFKGSMQRLNEIVMLLEKNEIELEEALTLFEEGMMLVKNCDSQLKHFEQKINVIAETYKVEEHAD